ncbi:hypothetical protein IWZ01DRAFT_229487 [Phyllosticta capitalensis]
MAHHGRRASGLFGVGSLFGRKDHPHPPSYYDELDRRHHRRRKSKRERDPHDHKRRRREHSPIVDAPDLEQLRRARAEYYGATPSERRREQPVRTAAAAEMPDKKGRSTRQYAYTRRRHDNKHPSKKEREEKDSAVYVYSTPASGNQGSSRSSLRNKRQNVDDGPDQVDIIEVEREASPPPRADPPRRTVSTRNPQRPVMAKGTIRRSSTTKVPTAAPEVASSESPAHQRRSSGLFGLFRHVPPAPPSPEKKHDCVICMDEVRSSRCPKLACGHRMCHSCMRRQFELSVKDPQHMPPRCCTSDHIPTKYVDRLFDTKFKILWNKKYQEFTTKNRLYCPSRGCGEWIKPSNIRMDSASGRKYAKCPRCRTKVCVLCNGKWHTRRQCPRDEETQRFTELAKESGWQRCYNCKAMVELKEGCNHMTCRCTAQFCMLCGAKWKTCECPWFNYNSLDDDDRLNDMRIPEPYVVIEHDEPGRGRDRIGRAATGERLSPEDYQVPAPRRHHPIYNAERSPVRRLRSMRERERERERADEALARRLQTQIILDAADDIIAPRRAHGGRAQQQHHPRAPPTEVSVEVINVGNAADHHMNDFGAPAQPASRREPATLRRSTTTRTRRATDSETDAAASRRMGYARGMTGVTGAGGERRSSVMAGLVDDGAGTARRHGLGRIGMWLAYVENDPAEVEGRYARASGVAY